MRSVSRFCLAATAMATILSSVPASADPLGYNDDTLPFPAPFFQQVVREPAAQPAYQADPQATQDETMDSQSAVADPRFQRQVVAFNTVEQPGTIIIDTPHTYLYYVMGGGRAIRYGIGVGRDGFRWAGVQTVANKQEWPDWHPPAEMIARQPYLPRMMAGGPGNPLGARAMYLGSSEYRIHGTNDPTTIGKRVSSGCIRLTNEDVEDLYNRVTIGTKVVVLPDSGYRAAAAPAPAPVRQRVSLNDSTPRPPMSIRPY